MNYTIFYKTSYENGNIDCGDGYDLFVSAYDGCERTATIFDKIKSNKKIWIDFPHYKNDLSEEHVYHCKSFREDECFIDLFTSIQLEANLKICIDITGFIRPHLIFFIKYLHYSGIKKIDFLYSEPQHYNNAEDTTFSGFITEVKVIEGCGSPINIPDTDNDLLIVSAGYDDNLIARILQFKSKIKKKYFLVGFPSLQPDMYQENILKINKVKDSIGKKIDKYAPAYDPFITAQVINEIVEENSNHSNIYLSPLSTKPQALGIAFYYLWNFEKKPISIIFPYSNTYHPKTAIGIKKTWKYTFELP
ncbi:MAG TPA: hypothetical protein VFI29_15165 [Hanamia sp.]|nr:hypothetical protein [Hanamia sp.]